MKQSIARKQQAAQKQSGRTKRTIARNRSARYEYSIEETFEAGVVLSGSEVRSLRERACQLSDAFCLIRQGEVWLHGVHIHPYSHSGGWMPDPDRKRKLLLHRKQIDLLDNRLRVKGAAFVPLELYFDEHNRVKLCVALARGKKLYDKRADMAKRDSDREIARVLKERSQTSY